MYEEGGYYIMKRRLYRVNPFCPYCHEEHCSYTISLSNEEQEQLDNYYNNHKSDFEHFTDLAILIYGLGEKPLVVKRKFKCICGKEFEKNVVVVRENEIGFDSPEFVEGYGKYAVN